MHSHRPLAITATALSAVLLGALALSGCTTSGAAGFAVGPAVAGDDHPTVAVIGDSIESGMNLDPDEAWPALIAVDRRWGVQNHSVPGAGFLALGPDGRTFDAQVDEAIAQFRPDAPSASLPALLALRRTVAALPADPVINDKRAQLDRIGVLATRLDGDEDAHGRSAPRSARRTRRWLRARRAPLGVAFVSRNLSACT